MTENVIVSNAEVKVVKELTPTEELIISTKELDKILKRKEKLEKDIKDLEVLAFEKQEEIQKISTMLVK